MDHLEQKVAQLYVDSGSVFQAGPPPMIRCSMQIRFDKVLGKTAEALATTPMTCPMEVAADICWKDLSIPCPEKWTRCVRSGVSCVLSCHWSTSLLCLLFFR
jgi:hypothetical protein